MMINSHPSLLVLKSPRRLYFLCVLLIPRKSLTEERRLALNVLLLPMKQGPSLNKERRPAEPQNSSLSASGLQSQCGSQPLSLVCLPSLLECCLSNCEPNELFLKLLFPQAFVTATRKVTNTVVQMHLTVYLPVSTTQTFCFRVLLGMAFHAREALLQDRHSRVYPQKPM